MIWSLIIEVEAEAEEVREISMALQDRVLALTGTRPKTKTITSEALDLALKPLERFRYPTSNLPPNRSRA